MKSKLIKLIKSMKENGKTTALGVVAVAVGILYLASTILGLDIHKDDWVISVFIVLFGCGLLFSKDSDK